MYLCPKSLISLVSLSKYERKHSRGQFAFSQNLKPIQSYITKLVNIATTSWFFYIFNHTKIIFWSLCACFDWFQSFPPRNHDSLENRCVCGFCANLKNDLYTIAGFKYINTPARTSISDRWPPAPVAQWIEQWIPNPIKPKIKANDISLLSVFIGFFVPKKLGNVRVFEEKWGKAVTV